MVTRVSIFVAGRVQGVGFRWWVRSRALELGLGGYAANLADGRVEVRATGERQACEALLELLGSGATPGEVTSLVTQWGEASDIDIQASDDRVFRER